MNFRLRVQPLMDGRPDQPASADTTTMQSCVRSLDKMSEKQPRGKQTIERDLPTVAELQAETQLSATLLFSPANNRTSIIRNLHAEAWPMLTIHWWPFPHVLIAIPTPVAVQ